MPNRFLLSGPTLGLVALVIGALAISFAPIFVKTSELGPAATAFHRMLLSLPLLIGLSFAQYRSGPSPARSVKSRRDYGLLLLAGAFFAGDLAVWHWSIQLTTVANATLFANAAPIFVAAGAWLLLGETFGVRFWLGLFVAGAGTVMVLGASLGGHGNVLGDALGLLTAVFYAGYFICVKLLRRSIGTFEIMVWSGLSATPILLLVALVSGEPLLAVTWHGWLILIGLAVISHTFGQSLIAFALAHLAASYSSLTLLIQPVGATILAWVLLGQGMQVQQALGGVTVLAGIFLARERSRVRRSLP
ncbi:MAG: DMT family transporter [Alphaproteobacteria bacterium]